MESTIGKLSASRHILEYHAYECNRLTAFDFMETGDYYDYLYHSARVELDCNYKKKLLLLRTALAAGMEFTLSETLLEDDRTLLHWTSSLAYTETIDLLMEYEQIDAEIADKCLESFFIDCPATLGNSTREAIATATALLSKGTNSQLIDSHGRNILHWSFGGELGPQCKTTYEIPTLLSTNPFNGHTLGPIDSSNTRLSLNHHSERTVITAGLRLGADLNALSHSGRPPFCFTTAEQFLSTALHLKSLGYLFVKVPRIWLFDAGIILMKDSGDKLPVSGLSIAEYLHEREKIRQSTVSMLWKGAFVLHAKWNKV